jgi:hypothetical protein
MTSKHERELWWAYQKAQEGLRVGKLNAYQSALRAIADRLGALFVSGKPGKDE